MVPTLKERIIIIQLTSSDLQGSQPQDPMIPILDMILGSLDRNYKEKMNYPNLANKKSFPRYKLLNNCVVTTACHISQSRVDSFLSWKSKGMDLLATTSNGFPLPPLCIFYILTTSQKALLKFIWLTNGLIINNINPSRITHLLHINDTEWAPLGALLLFRRKDFDESIAYRQKEKKAIQNHNLKLNLLWSEQA